MELKHFYSQDGVNWADLDDLTAEEAAVAERVNTQFSGDPAKVYEVNADGVEVIVKEGEDAPADEGAEQGMQSVTELKRLKYLAVTVTRDW